MTRKAALIAILALAAGGCAGMRKVEVGPTTGSTYRIDVYNARGSTVAVSYSDGGTERELGSVASGRTERFIIASPASTSVTVWARTSSGGRLGPYTVSLTGDVTEVTIR